ncbi:MAG: GNAT family N-acetyltransferase, partial [Geminicoccales bacterium]
MDYQFVQYRPEYRDQVLALLVSLWGSDAAFNSALFEWKYERNPYADPPFIFLALHRGRVVGMRGAFAGRWQGGDPPRPFPALCGADLFISPEHRGTGLFRQLLAASLNGMAAAGYSHTFNLSAVRLTFLGCLRMGWRCPGPYQVVRRESLSAALTRRGARLARRLGVPNATHAEPLERSAGPTNCFRALDRASARIVDSSG